MRFAPLLVVLVLSGVAHADSALVVAIDRTLPPDKVAAITHALVSTLDTLGPIDEVAIVSYGKTARVEVGLVSVKKRDRVSRAVAAIREADASDTAAGLRAAGDLLARSRRMNRGILLLTESNHGRYRPVMAALQKKGIVISALGYQMGSRAVLDELARAGGGRAYPLRRTADIGAAIRAAAGAKPLVPTLAIVLVIDRSGSMAGKKLAAAKEAVRTTVEVLGPEDTVALVAFDSESEVFVRPQRAANKARLSVEVSRLETGGGTNIYPGLKDAYELLGTITASQKHVIVLSDGEAPADGIVELVKEMRGADITVSSVGIEGADRNLLGMIAEVGEGRLYMVQDLASLPRIFMKETTY